MNTNYIKAKTKQDIKLRLLGLWQYDFGQILQVDGLDLPEVVQVHFYIKTKKIPNEEPLAYRVIAEVTDGILTVPIPDILLINKNTRKNYNIHAYIYRVDDESGESIAEIVMPVRARPKPDDYIPPDVEYSLADQVTQALNKATETLEIISNFEEEDPTVEPISNMDLINILS